jgi:UDP-glucuronate 4-epimerase
MSLAAGPILRDEKCEVTGRMALVTGAAGFIGSNLAERLLHDGWTVVGIDALTDYYSLSIKQANLKALSDLGGDFRFVQEDLNQCDLRVILEGVTHVFHQAGQPGVRSSWADGFAQYTERNILATQRLLEAARTAGVARFVYASSSSVYGNAAGYPTDESMLPRPQSPYGVTKLAGEHLTTLFALNYGLPTVSLRYFTVYGPRQRPDMATHRLINCALTGAPFTIFGDGSKVRDFTFVGDVVEANHLAAVTPCEPGSVFNVAGGSSTTMSDLVDLVGEVTGTRILLDQQPDAMGDVERTGGSIERIQGALGWLPAVSLRSGVGSQVDWQRSLLRV